MTTMLALTKQQGLRVCGWLAACALAASAATAQAQAPSSRIRSEISVSDVTPLAKTALPYAQARFDAGRLAANTQMTGMTVVFSRSAAQEAALKTLIAAQQNPASPLYHKWLTPEQFGAQFGMAQADLDKVEQWLQQQGFTIDSVARAGNYIRFSGTAGQVELAFQTQMHTYKIDGVNHISPSTAPSIPTALSGVVESVQNLTGLKPKASLLKPRRSYTIEYDSQAYTFFDPSDVKKAYDVQSLIGSGYDGTGQSIAVMGQSEISTTDITNFQTAAGLTTKTPNLIQVPGTGSAAVSSGDEGESDIDLEWSGAIAPGATIYFVYTGDSPTTNGVFDSITYAVDNKLGNIITVSYGSCELQLDGYSQDSTYEQAESQGQTIVASSGDTGSTACFGYSGLSTTIQQELSVNYPSSSEYVTGVGGTEIPAADDGVEASGSTGANWTTYWNTGSATGTLATLIQYIPENAWNDDTLSGQYSSSDGGGLSASTGGESTLYTSQPSWQSAYFTATGETNPDSTARLVPDVAFYASPNYPGYLFCSSDESDWSENQTGSCGNGTFLDGTVDNLTIAGGTSFAAPVFAGMVAVLNQAKGYTTGQGLLNPELYTLAANSTTYASAFHDVTSGNNYCTAGTNYSYCSSSGATEGYAATTGYDMVTGLGSLNLANLVTAWPESTSGSTLITTNTTLSATNTAPNVGASDTITITVASTAGGTTPSGTVVVSINSSSPSSYSPVTYTLESNGTYVLSETFSTAGVYTISAQYSGDSTHAASTGAITVTVGATSSGSGAFTLAATNVTVSQGSSGTSTITVTPSGGYTGTVEFGLSTSSSELETYGCYNQISNAVVSGTATATTTVTLYTSASDCSTAALAKRSTLHRFAGAGKIAASHQPPSPGAKTLPIGLAALAGFLLLGLRRRSKWITTLGCLLLLAGAGLAIGCGGGGSSSTDNNDVPKGTYTLTVTGEDSVSSSITNSTTFTLSID